MNKKTVLITGACINTGVAIVELFAAKNWNVVFTGRNCEDILSKEKEYKNKFPNVLIKGFHLEALKNDNSINEESVKELFEKLDRLNIFINCLVLNAADQGLGQQIFESTVNDFMKVINTNVGWNYCLIEQAAKRMKDKKNGSIVLVNSNTSYRAIPNRIAYIASKGAQLGMMRGMALDLGKYNIRINAVLPGMIVTDRWEKNPDFYKNVPSRFTPLGNVAYGKDIADAVYYFAEYSRNTTGAELVVDGGNTIQLYPIIPNEE